MQARLTLSLFGAFQVALDGKPITGFKSTKAQALLAYLMVEADRPHQREGLAGLLWPDYPEDAARASLRATLANVRQTIGDHQVDPPFLKITRQTIQLNRAGNHWLDAATFAEAMAEIDRPQPQIETLADGVALYRGPFLAGFSLSGCAAFEEWLCLKREEVNRHMLATLKYLADHFERRQRYDQALTYTWQQVDLEPWLEEAHQQLMRLLALSGRRSEALAQYERCRRILAEELGVEPTVETTILYEQIKAGDLNGRASPQHVSPARRHSLPLQLTPFVGRRAELAELTRFLTDPQVRLVSVVGPGGTGKSRLALEAAQRSQDHFVDGVFLVSLAPLRSAVSIIPAIATALGFSFYNATAPKQQLFDYLRQKTMLLIMDNFEHLLDGVGLLVELLENAPHIRILTSSRTNLMLQGEQRLLLHGLDYPAALRLENDNQPVTWANYGAVQLFVQQAQRVRPDFHLTPKTLPLVVQICRQVQGLPLGIILAAAWLRLLSLHEIVDEIKKGLDFLTIELVDLPRRQRSLRAVFAQSWQLLSKREQNGLQPVGCISRRV